MSLPAFDIEPFVGPLPIKFGMLPEEVHALFGPPDRDVGAGMARDPRSHYFRKGFRVF